MKVIRADFNGLKTLLYNKIFGTTMIGAEQAERHTRLFECGENN